MMKRTVLFAATFLLLMSSVGPGQDPPWTALTGTWSEVLSRSDGKKRSPGTLQIDVADGILTIVESAVENAARVGGRDLRCRLDGKETRYTTAAAAGTSVTYALKCKSSQQSVDLRGRFVIAGVVNAPPLEYETQKKLELAKDGTLRVSDRLTGIINPVGPVELWNTRSTFTKHR